VGSEETAVSRHRLLLGLLIGFAVGVTVARFGKYELGQYMGRLGGLGEAMEAVREEFGEVESGASEKSLFHLKTSSAVVVTVRGVKTIRVVP
jgi:hypothetical protein